MSRYLGETIRRLYSDERLIGMLSVFMAFIEPGDEVIIFEPYFDQSAVPCPSYRCMLWFLKNYYLQVSGQHKDARRGDQMRALAPACTRNHGDLLVIRMDD
jgi:hypothetical protein